MRRSTLEAVCRAWNAGRVRYLVAGGLAVVAHGHVRFTADLDVVLDPDTPNLRRALAALASLGYRPRAPVPLDAFVDARERRRWVRQKRMKVFSLFSDRHRETEIDLFCEPPFRFARAYRVSVRKRIGSRTFARFVSLADLLRMKRQAGRPQDLEDIRRLREVHGEA